MKISVVGAGHVGLPAAAGLASKSHKVTCVDIDEEKVEKINNGECPIHEDNLPELVEETVGENRLKATKEIGDVIENTEITLIAVETPVSNDGSINLDPIKSAAKDIGKNLREKEEYHLVVVKSTVVPETTRKEIIPVLEEESKKKAGEDFGICMNPEFLREGTALKDFLEPDRIVIGEYDSRSGDKLEALYKDFDASILRTSLETAEMIKYASNSLLATKISFINEIGNLCKELGIDTYEVADGIGMDHRLNRNFLNSGCGFGGSCFSKDLKAIQSLAEEKGLETKILESTISVNADQKQKMVEMLKQRTDGLEGKKVAVLGLAFKPGTDDVRKSPALSLISELKAEGAEVIGYDPEAIDNMKEVHPDINYTENYSNALINADASLILTDWPEFEQIQSEELPEPTIEGRKMDKAEGICW